MPRRATNGLLAGESQRRRVPTRCSCNGTTRAMLGTTRVVGRTSDATCCRVCDIFKVEMEQVVKTIRIRGHTDTSCGAGGDTSLSNRGNLGLCVCEMPGVGKG